MADTVVAADYLVVGGGAMGMAFVDALTTHADVKVAIVDRRHGPGGHWLDAYPFVRLHQASLFYGVASTPLGDGRVQTSGPETGLYERATASQIVSYYERVLSRLVDAGRVEFFGGCDYEGGTSFVSRLTGQRYRIDGPCRVVDAHYLAPDIPCRTVPPFIHEGVSVIPVNDLVRIADSPSQFVIVGAGKTSTDACVWLLTHGVDPDAICWIRPRDAWLLNRAVVQPDPAVFLGMVADTFEAASLATSPDDLFLRLEAAGVMLRIDPAVTPTMAKTPTIGQWEVDLLQTIENVVRLGHIREVSPGRVSLTNGAIRIARDAVVVHCAAAGIKHLPVIPIWGPDAITIQPVRSGFPCFGAAVIGYVEATRDDDGDKNRICPPSCFSDTTAGWARMQVLGGAASKAFGAEPDVKAWAATTTLNPARITPDKVDDPAVRAAGERFRQYAAAGAASFAAMAGA